MNDFMKATLASMVGTVLAVVGAIGFFLVIVLVIGMLSGEDESGAPERSVLGLKFVAPVLDRAPADNPFAEAFDAEEASSYGVDDILTALRLAKTDENVEGVYLQMGGIAPQLAALEEVRRAILDFRASGKFVVAYGHFYTQSSYLLASAADSIFLHPSGSVDFEGLSGTHVFIKDLLEAVGVEPQVVRAGKFKGATEMFTRESSSEENRLQTAHYLADVWTSAIENVSRERDIPVERLNEIADDYLSWNAEAALELGLVDGLVFEAALQDSIKNALEFEELEFCSVGDFVGESPAFVDAADEDADDEIALVYMLGEIVSGDGDDMTVGGDRYVRLLRDLAEDEETKAVVLRVNSPGGGLLPSEEIWREVRLLQEKKPVVVSMGDMCASGGYYISAPAKVLVAEPQSLVGSIGVFGLYFNARGFWSDNLGVEFETINTNPHADAYSGLRPLDETELAAAQRSVEESYETFVARVAEGRDMEPAWVDSIGQGRVWSGAKALEIGLEDTLAGMNAAVEIAAELANLEYYSIYEAPKQKDFFEEMFESFSSASALATLERRVGLPTGTISIMLGQRLTPGLQARAPFTLVVE
jgi:protease-4